MQNSIVRHTIVLIAALSVALVNTGCKSTGWNMPGSSWASWGKKKPPTSSIAGTRTTPQPPSVTVPPYPSTVAATSQNGPLNRTASNTGPRASQPATSPAAYGPTPRYPAQQTASSGGYFTGPYNTGQASTAGTQHGFYSPTMSKPAGPAAYTADSRNRTTPLPAGSATPRNGSATRTTRPAGSTGYPARSPYGPPPAPSYPSSTSTTPSHSSAPGYSSPTTPSQGTAYPPRATAPGTYATPSYNRYRSPASYPTTPTRTQTPPASTSIRPSTSPYGAVPVSATGPIRAANTGNSISRSATAGSQPKSYASPSSGGYQPGSTARASNLLPPTTGTTAPSNYAASPTTSRYGPSASTAAKSPSAAAASAYRAPSYQTPSYQTPTYPGTTYRGPSSSGYPVPTRTATPTGSSRYPSTYSR